MATEFYYQRGRADVVALSSSGEVIAFECKLTRWKDALHQAYRNTCFAHMSYVVLPEDTALLAARYAEEFRRRGVGICYLADDQVVTLQEAHRRTPLQPWLSGQATAHASQLPGHGY